MREPSQRLLTDPRDAKRMVMRWAENYHLLTFYRADVEGIRALNPIHTLHDQLLQSARPWSGACKRQNDDRRSGVLPRRRWRAASAGERIVTRIRSRLLLDRWNRLFQVCVACQPQRPQSGGLFTRGRTRCLVFGHCLLPLSQLLFLFLESRFGSVTRPFSVGVQSP